MLSTTTLWSSVPTDGESMSKRSQVISDDVYERFKPMVWVITVEGIDRGKRSVSQLTGFCVHDEGILMTCAHYSRGNPQFRARRIDKKGLGIAATKVRENRAWDLALFKVSGPKEDFAVTELAADGSLHKDETVFTLGNLKSLFGCFSTGQVVYPCVEAVTLPEKFTSPWNFENNASTTTRPYRIMGDICNSSFLGQLQSMYASREVSQAARVQTEKLYDYLKYLDPLVPIIQLTGIPSTHGASGSPIFNSEGKVVGCLTGQSDGFEIAVHVTLMRRFLTQVLEQG